MLFLAFLSHSLNYSAPDFQGFLKNNFNHFGKEQILFINSIPEFTDLSEFSWTLLNFYITVILKSLLV